MACLGHNFWSSECVVNIGLLVFSTVIPKISDLTRCVHDTFRNSVHHSRASIWSKLEMWVSFTQLNIFWSKWASIWSKSAIDLVRIRHGLKPPLTTRNVSIFSYQYLHDLNGINQRWQIYGVLLIYSHPQLDNIISFQNMYTFPFEKLIFHMKTGYEKNMEKEKIWAVFFWNLSLVLDTWVINIAKSYIPFTRILLTF